MTPRTRTLIALAAVAGLCGGAVLSHLSGIGPSPNPESLVRGAVESEHRQSVPPPTSSADVPIDSDQMIGGLQASPLGELRDLHRRMVSDGLALWRGNLEVVDVQTSRHGEPVVDVQLAAGRASALWAPAEATPLTPTTARATALHRDALEWIATIGTPFEAVFAFSDDGEVLAVGSLESDSTFATVPASPPFFLGSAAAELDGVDYLPIPTGDTCAPSRLWRAESQLGKLVEYVTELDLDPVDDRSARDHAIDEQVEQLLISGAGFVDEVLGISVEPARNDIARQLRAGASPADVLLRPALPVGIVLPPETDTSWREVFVVTDSVSGDVLGWLPATPMSGTSESGVEEFYYETVLHVAPPSEGAGVTILRRDTEDGQFDCPGMPPEEVVVAVGAEWLEREVRAHVNLVTGEVRELTAADLAEN